MKKSFLLLTILFFISIGIFAQHKNTYTISSKDKTYVFKILTKMSKDSTYTYGYVAYDIVNYEISNKKGLLDAGNLSLPQKKDKKAIRIVDIKITQSEIIILKSHAGFIFKYKLNDNGIMEKI